MTATASRKLVVDASVAVKWYVAERGSGEAAALLAGDAELVAPDLLFAEFGNILWKKVRRGALTQVEADEIIAAFVWYMPVRVRSSGAVLEIAHYLAAQYQRSVYDALYLAVALAEACPMVTADARLHRALQGTPLADIMVLLPGE